MNGFKADTDTFLEVTKEELENVELEFDTFVERSEYMIRPYYLCSERQGRARCLCGRSREGGCWLSGGSAA